MSTESAGRGIVLDSRRSPNTALRPVPISHVRIDDGFWAPRRKMMRESGLGHQFKMCESTGRIDNFRRVSRAKDVPHRGKVFNDSDVYKLLEAASYALADQPDEEIGRSVDDAIDEIEAAQHDDGYINTYFSLEREHERYSDLTTKHELYCAGHLIQAAVAHKRATGSDRLLVIARRFADHICATFGRTATQGTDGHEEIELALVELYRLTGATRYLEAAGYFLEARGREPSVMPEVQGAFGRAYYQDHMPVAEQSEAVGHAVRATYLATGMMDVALEADRPELAAAAERLWDSAYGRKSYVTGGLGARYEGESFGADFELPNEAAYAETCAAIGGVFWNWRMLLNSQDARYADTLENALYNGALAGISLDGARYFYMNPLTSRGGYERSEWFDCACCPPNIARLLMSLPGYIYSTSKDAFWVHLYAAGKVRTTLPNGDGIALEINTRYPWDGVIEITVTEAPSHGVELKLRIPAWSPGATATVNGDDTAQTPRPGTYLGIERTWEPGDSVTLTLPMEVRRIVSHPRVVENHGRVALARGPLIYCIEETDHAGADLFEIALPRDAKIEVAHDDRLLEGAATLRATAERITGPGNGNVLYGPAGGDGNGVATKVAMTAVPFYAWGNRGEGAMQVWIPEARTA